MAQNKKKEREGDPTKIKKRETNKVSLWAAHVVGQTRLYFLGKLVKDAENVNLENTNLELSTQAGYTYEKYDLENISSFSPHLNCSLFIARQLRLQSIYTHVIDK